MDDPWLVAAAAAVGRVTPEGGADRALAQSSGHVSFASKFCRTPGIYLFVPLTMGTYHPVASSTYKQFFPLLGYGSIRSPSLILPPGFEPGTSHMAGEYATTELASPLATG